MPQTDQRFMVESGSREGCPRLRDTVTGEWLECSRADWSVFDDVARFVNACLSRGARPKPIFRDNNPSTGRDVLGILKEKEAPVEESKPAPELSERDKIFVRYGEEPRWLELLAAARALLGSAPSFSYFDGAYTRSDPSPVFRLQSAVRAFDQPAPKRHVFGGVEFEETGERRSTQPGEWFLWCDRPYLRVDSQDHHGAVPILRPVGVEPPDA